MIQENDSNYIFQSSRGVFIFWRKNNYHDHRSRHPEISDEKGREEIENVLVNPTCITEYFQKNALGKPIAETVVFYYEIEKRNTFQGKRVSDHWKVVTVHNVKENRWEIATAFIRTSPPYAMINDRVEHIVYKKDDTTQ